jgi:hypothetical protein
MGCYLQRRRMEQSTPALIAIGSLVFGGAGVLGGAFAALKYLTSERNEELNSLRRRLQDTERSLELLGKVKSRENDLFLTLTESLCNLDRGQLSAQNVVEIQNILGQVEDARDVLERWDDCREAARWLKFRKGEWIKNNIRAVIHSYRKDIPISKRKMFKRDIFQCFDWAYESLMVGHPDISIDDFLGNPVIQSPFPYMEAIRLIKGTKDCGNLSFSQSMYLDMILDELIEKISHKFSS